MTCAHHSLTYRTIHMEVSIIGWLDAYIIMHLAIIRSC